ETIKMEPGDRRFMVPPSVCSRCGVLPPGSSLRLTEQRYTNCRPPTLSFSDASQKRSSPVRFCEASLNRQPHRALGSEQRCAPGCVHALAQPGEVPLIPNGRL